MRALADFILTGMSFVEAQANHLKKGVVRTAVALSLVKMAAVFVLGAAGFFLAAAYIAMAPALGPAIAALLTGGGALLLGLIVLGVGRLLTR